MSGYPRDKKVFYMPSTGERCVNIYIHNFPEAIYLRLMGDVGAYEECKDFRSSLLYRVEKGLGLK